MSGKGGMGKKGKNRVHDIIKKLEQSNNFREILKDPRKFQKHLECARDAYIATGAFLDDEGRCDSIIILEEIMRDLRLAAPRYDFDIEPEIFVANMQDDQRALQELCRKYVRSNNPSKSRSAKKKAMEFLKGLNLKRSVKDYVGDLEAERQLYLRGKKKEREMKRMVEEARAAEKKYWKKTPVKKDFQLNRVGRFIDGSEAKKNFLENRVQNHFAEAASLGIEEHKLKELTMYYNGCIQEPDDSRGNTIVKDTKIIMKKELARLGVPEHYVRSLMAKLDSLRKDYQTQKVAFYAAYNSAPVQN